MADVLQRCRTANCPNRQVDALCADHGGPRAKPAAKARPAKRPAAKPKAVPKPPPA